MARRYPHPLYPSIACTRSGEVYSSGRLLKGSTDSSGYTQVNVKDIKKLRQAHRLVYECVTGKVLPEFNRYDQNSMTLNHDDGNKQNNAFSNLEMMTHLENKIHSRKVLKRKQLYGEGVLCINSQLSYNDFKAIVGLIKAGVSNKEIAQSYPLDCTNVSRLRTRNSYKPEWARYDKEFGRFDAEPKTKFPFETFCRVVRAAANGKDVDWIAGKANVWPFYIRGILNRTSLKGYWKRYDAGERAI